MSCIYLNKSHYQFVADSIACAILKYSNKEGVFHTKSEFRATADTIKESEDLILIYIKKLQNWNAVAWCTRYPQELADQDPMDYVREIKQIAWSDLDIFQLLKALECIDYQCIDSDKYSSSLERKILKEIIEDCKDAIIKPSLDYQSAKWGL